MQIFVAADRRPREPRGFFSSAISAAAKKSPLGNFILALEKYITYYVLLLWRESAIPVSMLIPRADKAGFVGDVISMDTHKLFQVRLGQTWKEQNPTLGLRICVVEKIQCGQVLLRTVFDEGLIGSCETSVPVESLMDRQAHWQFVSEPHHFSQ